MKFLTSLMLLIIFFLTPLSANAQTCGVFQKKVNDLCVHFDVPANAHLTYSGNSWDCNRGFKKSSDGLACEEIKIPNNATGNLIGSFNCNSGFEKVEDGCRRVENVENGKFYEFGNDFYCLSGYKRSLRSEDLKKNEESKSCERIIIPQNARADDSSLEGWRCFSGYIKEDDECKEFKLPEHAFWFIDFWGCEPGYKKNFDAKSCDKISIPENAHASNTFDGWLCNDGYDKNYKDNRCDKIN